MKTFFRSVVCASALIATGPLAYAAQAPATTTAKPTDRAVDARIEQRLKADPTLKNYNIKVSVDGSVATLSGSVPTEADRAKAADVAKVNGITRVDNQIIVDVNAASVGTAGTLKEKSREGADKTKDGAEKAYGKTKNGAEKALDKTKDGTKAGYGKAKSGVEKGADKSKDGGEKVWDKSKDVGGKVAEKSKEGASKTAEAVTDGWITTRIKADMVNEDSLHDSAVHVDTNNHVVTLSGTVMSEAGRARAVEIAKGTKGVDRVIDRITIGPKK